MPETAGSSNLARRPKVATLRTLTWFENEHFHGWCCSECAWAFTTSGPPKGKSLGEMIENYERLRDIRFAGHVCAEHPRATKLKG
jgi:hypothetical protein